VSAQTNKPLFFGETFWFWKNLITNLTDQPFISKTTEDEETVQRLQIELLWVFMALKHALCNFKVRSTMCYTVF